jgi:hypothetical protein
MLCVFVCVAREMTHGNTPLTLEEVIGTPKKEDFVSHMPICPYVYVDVYVGVYVYALLMSNEQVTCVVELGFEWWVIVTSSESRMVS